MIEYSTSLVIESSVESVWALLGDPVRWPAWIGDVADVGGPDEIAVGSVIEYRWRGNRVKADVTHFEPERVIGIHSSEKRYEFYESFAVEPAGPGTRVAMTVGFRPKGLWMKALSVAVAPLKGVLLGRPAREALAGLNRAVVQ